MLYIPVCLKSIRKCLCYIKEKQILYNSLEMAPWSSSKWNFVYLTQYLSHFHRVQNFTWQHHTTDWVPLQSYAVGYVLFSCKLYEDYRTGSLSGQISYYVDYDWNSQMRVKFIERNTLLENNRKYKIIDRNI